MNLRQLRGSRGYQRKYVIGHIKISGKHLNDVEAGRVNLTDKVANKLANFYGLDVDVIKKMYKEGKNEEQRDSKKAEKIN